MIRYYTLGLISGALLPMVCKKLLYSQITKICLWNVHEDPGYILKKLDFSNDGNSKKSSQIVSKELFIGD